MGGGRSGVHQLLYGSRLVCGPGPGHPGKRGKLRPQQLRPGEKGDGGVRLRQPHRPHAHGQRPGRRAGGHPGQRAGPGRLEGVEGVLRQRRGQPDQQVRPVYLRPLPADCLEGRYPPLPRGRLSGGGHQGAGPGSL